MMYKHTITVYDTKTLQAREDDPRPRRARRLRLQGQDRAASRAPRWRRRRRRTTASCTSRSTRCTAPGFYHEGHDVGGASSGFDKSFVYRVRLSDLKIDKVIKVGSVPKYLAVTPDQKYLLVSNWDSYSSQRRRRARRASRSRQIYLGPYPRGIAVSPDSRTAYVAVMGSYDIAKVDLTTFRVSWIRGVGLGAAPRRDEPERQVPVRDAERRGPRRQDRPRAATTWSTRSTPGSSRAAWRWPPTARRCTSSTTTPAR